MSLKPNTKKKIWVGIGVFIIILAMILTGGYFAVNKLFSMFTRSLYDSSEMLQTQENQPQQKKEQDRATEQSDKPKEPEQENAEVNQTEDKQQVTTKQPTYTLSAQQIALLESKVSFSDKLAVMSILSKSLPAAEYSELAGMVSGGITQGEVGRAYQIFNHSLSQESKNKIKEYYAKYSYLLN